MTTGLTAPDFTGVQNTTGFASISGYSKVIEGSEYIQVSNTEAEWVPFSGSCVEDIKIYRCGSRAVELTDAMKVCLDARYADLKSVVISEAPSPDGFGDDCVSNSGLLPACVFILFIFSLCVQMAEGLTYGVVPSVSRPALGVVSGMVGAGGNAGALITNALFFTSDLRTDTGLVYMGLTIIGVTALLFLVYFPDMGSMLTPAGAIPYDPQIIKPPAGYRGADSMDYSANVDKPKPDAEKAETTTAEGV